MQCGFQLLSLLSIIAFELHLSICVNPSQNRNVQNETTNLARFDDLEDDRTNTRIFCDEHISNTIETMCNCKCIRIPSFASPPHLIPMPNPYPNMYLDCSKRKLWQVPTCFVKLDRMKTLRHPLILDLSGNRFSKLNAKLPSRIKALLVRNSAISHERSNTQSSSSRSGLVDPLQRPLTSFNLILRDYPFLQYLDLSFNELINFPLIQLREATSLNTVKLRKNEIEYIPPFAFGFHHNLVYLDLSTNKIRRLAKRSFIRHRNAHAGPIVLDYLDLSYNHLDHFSPGTFDNLTNLRTLLLQGNRLLRLDCSHQTSVWLNLFKLSYLDLDYNQISVVNIAHPHCFPRLANLSLSGNRLNALTPCQFSLLSSLKSVQLADNHFESIDHCAFHRISHSVKSISLVANKKLKSAKSCSLFQLAPGSVQLSASSIESCDCQFYAFTHFAPYSVKYLGDECKSFADTSAVHEQKALGSELQILSKEKRLSRGEDDEPNKRCQKTYNLIKKQCSSMYHQCDSICMSFVHHNMSNWFADAAGSACSQPSTIIYTSFKFSNVFITIYAILLLFLFL